MIELATKIVFYGEALLFFVFGCLHLFAPDESTEMYFVDKTPSGKSFEFISNMVQWGGMANLFYSFFFVYTARTAQDLKCAVQIFVVLHVFSFCTLDYLANNSSALGLAQGTMIFWTVYHFVILVVLAGLLRHLPQVTADPEQSKPHHKFIKIYFGLMILLALLDFLPSMLVPRYGVDMMVHDDPARTSTEESQMRATLFLNIGVCFILTLPALYTNSYPSRTLMAAWGMVFTIATTIDIIAFQDKDGSGLKDGFVAVIVFDVLFVIGAAICFFLIQTKPPLAQQME